MLLVIGVQPVMAEEEELQSYEVTLSATQWEGVTETFELDDGGTVEITISNVQDVPQPRSTEELGIGTWTRYILYKYTGLNGNVMQFGWTFKVKVTVDAYPMFPVYPYDFVIVNCAATSGPSIFNQQATASNPASMSGSATASANVSNTKHATLIVTCDKDNMLTLTTTTN